MAKVVNTPLSRPGQTTKKKVVGSDLPGRGRVKPTAEMQRRYSTGMRKLPNVFGGDDKRRGA